MDISPMWVPIKWLSRRQELGLEGCGTVDVNSTGTNLDRTNAVLMIFEPRSLETSKSLFHTKHLLFYCDNTS